MDKDRRHLVWHLFRLDGSEARWIHLFEYSVYEWLYAGVKHVYFSDRSLLLTRHIICVQRQALVQPVLDKGICVILRETYKGKTTSKGKIYKNILLCARGQGSPVNYPQGKTTKATQL